MCKNLLKGLLGGGGAAPQAPAVQQEQTVEKTADAQVKNTDVVDALTGGRESSGRVRLGKKAGSRGAVAGLTI